MEPVNLQDTGGGYASCPPGSSFATETPERIQTPETLTPIWENLVQPEAILGDRRTECSGGILNQTQNETESLESKVQSTLLRNRTSVTKPTKRLGGKGSIKTSTNDVNLKIQALAGNVERINKEEQASQGAIEAICAQLTEAFEVLKREHMTREEAYVQRFNALEQRITIQEQRIVAQEQEINELRSAHNSKKQRSASTILSRPTPAIPLPPRPVPVAPVSESTADATDSGERTPKAPRVPESRTQGLPEKQARGSYATIASNNSTRSQEWQITPPKGRRNPLVPRNEASPEPNKLKPVKEKSKEARRLLFRREEGLKAPEVEKGEVILALNRALARKGFPEFIRVVDANYTKTGALSVLLERGALGTMLVPHYSDLLVTAIRQADQATISVELPDQWYKIKVHGVAIRRYLHLGLGLAREEIELGTEYKLMRDPVWLRNPQEINGKGSTIVITVGSHEALRKILVNGIRFGGVRYRTERFWELGADTICPRCCGIGHKSFRACGDRPVCCFICAGAHEGSEHICKVVNCSARQGTACQHTPAKCGNCGGSHPAMICPKTREVRKNSNRQSEDNKDLASNTANFAAISPERPSPEYEILSSTNGTLLESRHAPSREDTEMETEPISQVQTTGTNHLC